MEPGIRIESATLKFFKYCSVHSPDSRASPWLNTSLQCHCVIVGVSGVFAGVRVRLYSAHSCVRRVSGCVFSAAECGHISRKE